MKPEELAERIRSALPDAVLELSGADCTFEVLVVSEFWTGQSAVARQRMLLGLFASELASGALHALSIRARTPAELQSASNQSRVVLGTLPKT
ncbi:MAG TPA: BolA/IbaG family iron-sulfur metabolism protein [Polyangiales bacterium]|nr:BolA/IbaG family iron-sulfur metabolism protein [Polyangiales bacterium]